MSEMPTKGADEKFCADCGQVIKLKAEICAKCGVRQMAPVMPAAPAGARNKLTAALFAIFLGGLGVHKFYLGKVIQGILYIVFCWTFIPSVIGFIEGIVYLSMSEETFEAKYGTF